jgi:hypothetical protein
MAAVTSIVRNNVQGKIEIEVDGFDPLVLLYTRGDGNLGPLDKYLNERVDHNTRGQHLSSSWGNRMYPAFNLSAFWTELIGSDDVEPGSMLEAMFQLGAYDDSGSMVPPTATVRWTIFGAIAGLANNEVITMTNVAFSATLTEAVEGNSIACAGSVKGSVAITRGGKTITLAQINPA